MSTNNVLSRRQIPSADFHNSVECSILISLLASLRGRTIELFCKDEEKKFPSQSSSTQFGIAEGVGQATRDSDQISKLKISRKPT